MGASEEIIQMAKSLGATFAGIADLSPAAETLRVQGGDGIAHFPRAISIGVALPSAIVDGIENQNDRVAVMNYRHHGYDVINPRLDAVASRIASEIQDRGHAVYPIAASQTIDRQNQLGTISHKMAARLAGLGWIGKSCLLVTPEVGPRVRWATVLTDAPLEPTGVPADERCGDCRECVDICPAGAFTGRPFKEDEPREARFDVHKCAEHQARLYKDTGFGLCGLCLYVCPQGKRKTP